MELQPYLVNYRVKHNHTKEIREYVSLQMARSFYDAIFAWEAEQERFNSTPQRTVKVAIQPEHRLGGGSGWLTFEKNEHGSWGRV